MNDPAPLLRCLLNCYASRTEMFLLENNNHFNILITVDNILRYPPLHYDLHSYIKVIFLTTNTTSLTQPMGQGLEQLLKAYH